MRRILPLLVILSLAFAPAPFPRPGANREIEDLSRKASASAKAVADLQKRILCEGKLSPDDKAELMKRHRSALEQAAKEYTQLARLLNSLKQPSSAQKALTTEASFKAARFWFQLANYKAALQIYDRLVRNASDPETRVHALGGRIGCHAALGKSDEIRQNLVLIREAIPKLSEQKRVAWEGWLRACDSQLK
jgi:hypothetical protein